MTPEIVVLGTVTRDMIKKGGRTEVRFGGAPFFAAIVLDRMKIPVGVVCTIGRKDAQALAAFKFLDQRGVLKRKETCEVTINTNGSATIENFEGKLGFGIIPKQFFDAKSFVVSTVSDEVTAHMLQRIRKRYGGLIAIDLQGFTRPGMKGRSKIELKSHYKKIPNNLPGIIASADVLKLNETELDALARGGYTKKKLEEITRTENKIVLLTHGKSGFTLLRGGSAMRFRPKNLEKETQIVGAGDKFLVLFMHKLAETKDPVIAAKYANRAITGFLRF